MVFHNKSSNGQHVLFGTSPHCVWNCRFCKIDTKEKLRYIMKNNGCSGFDFPEIPTLDDIYNSNKVNFEHGCCCTDILEHGVKNKVYKNHIQPYARGGESHHFQHRKVHNNLNRFLFMLSIYMY